MKQNFASENVDFNVIVHSGYHFPANRPATRYTNHDPSLLIPWASHTSHSSHRHGCSGTCSGGMSRAQPQPRRFLIHQHLRWTTLDRLMMMKILQTPSTPSAVFAIQGSVPAQRRLLPCAAAQDAPKASFPPNRDISKMRGEVSRTKIPHDQQSQKLPLRNTKSRVFLTLSFKMLMLRVKSKK